MNPYAQLEPIVKLAITNSAATISTADATALSQAASLKRIADALESIAQRFAQGGAFNVSHTHYDAHHRPPGGYGGAGGAGG